MSFDKDIEEDIKKEELYNKDPLETAKRKLRDKQENDYAIPEKKFVEIDIPTTGKIGDDLIIKFSGKSPKSQATISNAFEWKRADKYNPNSPKQLIAKPMNIVEDKDSDKIVIPLVHNSYSKGKPFNVLTEGDYLVQARAYGIQVHEDITATRIIRLYK